jgi:aminoglycoside phosphotransferase (APT) family kinase protein
MVEAGLGSQVIEFASATSGYSPALAGVARLADQRRIFVKGIPRDQHPGLGEVLAREIAINASLASYRPPAPVLLGHWTGQAWTVAAWEAVDGPSPGNPWTEEQLRDVGRTLRLVRALPVTGLPAAAEVYGEWFGGWARLAEGDPARAHRAPADSTELWWRPRLPLLQDLERHSLDTVVGGSFVHNDVRSDNLLVTASGSTLVVDWGHCCAGADWLDAALFSISFATEDGLHPDRVLDLLGIVIPNDLKTEFIAGWAGYLVHASRLPPTPQTEDLRHHQQRKAAAAIAWLGNSLSA